MDISQMPMFPNNEKQTSKGLEQLVIAIVLECDYSSNYNTMEREEFLERLLQFDDEPEETITDYKDDYNYIGSHYHY